MTDRFKMFGILPEGSDVDKKRVKRCATCGYFYIDKTRPNNSKTCSAECKTDRDTARRREKTQELRRLGVIEDVKPTIMQRSYYRHYEYSFWNGDGYKYDGDSAMEVGLSNYEQPYGNIEDIYAAKERYETWGGRKRHATEQAKDYYNGDWDKNFK